MHTIYVDSYHRLSPLVVEDKATYQRKIRILTIIYGNKKLLNLLNVSLRALNAWQTNEKCPNKKNQIKIDSLLEKLNGRCRACAK